MVLTIRPPKGSSDELGDPQSTDRLAVRRAAIELMTDQGYADVTVDDIVARVGISRRTFFRLFAGKHQVLSCDHGAYYAEVCDYLSRHDSDRTLARAAEAVRRILESLTADRGDARIRMQLVGSDDALIAEENRWFALYQITLAEFLTQPQGSTTSLEAEMLAASMLTAVRITLRDWLADPSVSATDRLNEGVRLLQSDASRLPTRRRVAIIQTTLTVDELAERLAD